MNKPIGIACATRILLTLMLPVAVPAQDETSLDRSKISGFALVAVPPQDYRFETNHNAIIINKYTGSGGAVTIPDKIDGLPVTSLWNGAFENCRSLTGVTIPSSVTQIGAGVFEDCTNLTTVTIGPSVTSIGAYAFSGCFNLSRITIPNNVTQIGDLAFGGCTNLTRLYFQGNAPRIVSDVFYGANQATVYYLPKTTGWGETFGHRPTAVWSGEPQTQ